MVYATRCRRICLIPILHSELLFATASMTSQLHGISPPAWSSLKALFHTSINFELCSSYWYNFSIEAIERGVLSSWLHSWSNIYDIVWAVEEQSWDPSLNSHAYYDIKDPCVLWCYYICQVWGRDSESEPESTTKHSDPVWGAEDVQYPIGRSSMCVLHIFSYPTVTDLVFIHCTSSECWVSTPSS